MIVRFSLFSIDPWGDGGARRTCQISEMLAEAGLPVKFIALPEGMRRLSSLANFYKTIRFFRHHRLPIHICRNLLFTTGNDLCYFRAAFRKLPANSALLWEATRSRYSFIPFLAKECGLRVIGLPHNLESLVPSSQSFITGKGAPDWFDEEVQSLAACDELFAISREDQWLLRIHGIDAVYLPYQPPPEVADAMLRIRETRKKRAFGRDLLLLGTIYNPPTYLGMKDRLEFLIKYSDKFDKLHVVGYGTECLNDIISGDMSVVLHGTVDSNRLHALLESTRAAIIHQSPTSGALTRIPELLLAGVPVLANVDAARSYFERPGVYVYENDAQLLDFLAGQLDVVEPSIFSSGFTESFLNNLKQ